MSRLGKMIGVYNCFLVTPIIMKLSWVHDVPFDLGVKRYKVKVTKIWLLKMVYGKQLLSFYTYIYNRESSHTDSPWGKDGPY